MNLKKELLITEELNYEFNEKFNSCLNAHGLYNSMHFVVRLSPIVHEHVDKINEGLSGKDLEPEMLQAFSTLFHETIHWWQHIGSTTGLMLSLGYPAQTHQALEHIRKYLIDTGSIKSIHRYNELNATEFNPTTSEFENINIILNNFFDIEYFRSLLIDPTSAFKIKDAPLFECVGHCYSTAYAFSILTVQDVFDRESKYLPNTDNWIGGFQKLKEERVTGYFHGSDICLPPLGLKEIFEGQARFNQIQFLYFSFGGILDWEDFKEMGFLEGIYVAAFEMFLGILGIEWPKKIDAPEVALFLLICDLAINPGEGFPFECFEYMTFTISVDPGIRFVHFCKAIREEPELIYELKDYSKEEYESMTEKLCGKIKVYSPSEIYKEIVSWSKDSEAFVNLLKEEEELNFKNENQPVRVIFAKFLRISEDRYRTPEFFCWPGFWMWGSDKEGSKSEVFKKHQSLFTDKKDDNGIYPRIFPGVSGENVHATFNNFYAWNIMYDLTRQLIIKDGNFDYDYSWLTQKQDNELLKEWADKIFIDAYGISPDEFEVLN